MPPLAAESVDFGRGRRRSGRADRRRESRRNRRPPRRSRPCREVEPTVGRSHGWPRSNVRVEPALGPGSTRTVRLSVGLVPARSATGSALPTLRTQLMRWDRRLLSRSETRRHPLLRVRPSTDGCRPVVPESAGTRESYEEPHTVDPERAHCPHAQDRAGLPRSHPQAKPSEFEPAGTSETCSTTFRPRRRPCLAAASVRERW